MATPQDRRVIFSSYVIPKESYPTTNLAETTEEGFDVGRASYTDYRIDSNVSKRLGGKGIASISEAQWNDGWTSMFHSKVNWEDLDSDGASPPGPDVIGNRWEDEYTCWDGTLLVKNANTLTPDSVDDVMKFLYIKNVGTTHNATVFYGANSATRSAGDMDDSYSTFTSNNTNYNAESSSWDEDYKILIPPGASICLRGDGANQQCDDIYVSCDDAGAGTEIEYLIAK